MRTIKLFVVVLLFVVVPVFAGDNIMTISMDGTKETSYTTPSKISAHVAVSNNLTIVMVDWGTYSGTELTLSGHPLFNSGVEIITSAGKSWIPTKLTRVGDSHKVAMPLSDGAIVFFWFRYAGTENYITDPALYGDFYLPNGYKGNGHDVKGPIASFKFIKGKPVPLN